MERSWLSLLLLSLVPVVIQAEVREEIDRCPLNKVCVIFANDGCVSGSDPIPTTAWEGYLWEADTRCSDGNYKSFWAALEIEPRSLRKWNIIVTTWAPTGGLRRSIDSIGINFGKNHEVQMEFIDEKTMELVWDRTAQSSRHSMIKIGSFENNNNDHYERFSFEIEAHGKKLFDLLGVDEVEVVFPERKLKMEDGRFSSILKHRTGCVVSELKRVCYGECNEMQISTSNSYDICLSKLWFHQSSENDILNWNKVDKIQCDLGTWQIKWSNGIIDDVSSLEFQCSEEKPPAAVPKPTTTPTPSQPADATTTATSTAKTAAETATTAAETATTKATAAPAVPVGAKSDSNMGTIIGCAAGGILLLAVIVIGVILFVRFIKRRKHNQTGKGVSSARGKTTPRGSGKAPGKLGAAREQMQEHTAVTNFEGLKTEILNEKTASAHLGPQEATAGVANPVPTIATIPSIGSKTPSFVQTPY